MQSMGDVVAKLGPFALEELLGQGGMGQVWAARHTDGCPVAVKVVTDERLSDNRYRVAFDREIQAIVRLHHPGIVHIHETGLVPDGVPGLPAGAPYLVMPRAEGTLNDTEPADWATAAWILECVLGGLAHAHAHGVLHRDIKPTNILRGADGELLLSDFGVARLEEEGAQPMWTCGTPGFMAPEQIENRWRDEGPGTDLYAVGCLAYFLLSGAPPFRDAETTDESLLRAHVHADLAPVEPTIAIPRAAQNWLDILLAKDIRDRFPSAAHALVALRPLKSQPVVPVEGEPKKRRVATESPTAVLGPAAQAARALGRDSATTRPEILLDPGSSDAGHNAPLARTGSARSERSLRARRWIGLAATAPAGVEVAVERLRGTGLGLFGIRHVPLVGRAEEQSRLWAALREVYLGLDPGAVVIEGASGVGTSRLAEWIAHAAGAAGGGHAIRIKCTPSGAALAVANALARTLGTVGLTPRRAQRRLMERWSCVHHVVPALLDVLYPRADVQRTSPMDRALAFEAFLSACSHHSPAVVVVDDAQWDPALLRYLTAVLARGRVAALCVATVKDEVLRTNPESRQQLEMLLAEPAATLMHVGPLQPSDHAALVERLLPLQPDLVYTIARRTYGNPMFAVQLVGELVEREALQDTAQGFALDAGGGASLPQDAQGLWSERVDRLVSASDDVAGSRTALELAATLGLDVHVRDWEAVLDGAGLVASLAADVGRAGTMAGMLIHTDTGWAFTHAVVRAAVLDGADRFGRLAAHHLVCAEVLEARYAHHPAAAAERVAAHYVAAGQASAAVAALQIAAESRRERGDFGMARSHLEELESVLAGEGRDADEAFGWSLVRQARIAALQSRLDDAESLLVLAEGAEGTSAWNRAEALCVAAIVHQVRGADPVEGIALLEEAKAGFEALSDRAGVARCLHSLGEQRKQRGDLEAARTNFEEALHQLSGEADESARHTVLLGLADVYRRTGDRASYDATMARCLDWFASRGSLRSRAVCFNLHGDACRDNGDLDGAERAYRRARSILEAAGSADAAVLSANLGLVQLDRGRPQEARHLLEQALETLEGVGAHQYRGWLQAGLAVCAQELGQPSERDRRRVAAQDEQTGMFGDEVAALLARLT